EAQRAGVERDPSQPLLYPRHVTSPVPGSNSTHGMTRSARFARRPRGGDLLPVPPPYGIARPQAAGRPGRASFIQGTTPTADRRSGPAEPSFSSGIRPGGRPPCGLDEPAFTGGGPGGRPLDRPSRASFIKGPPRRQAAGPKPSFIRGPPRGQVTGPVR